MSLVVWKLIILCVSCTNMFCLYPHHPGQYQQQQQQYLTLQTCQVTRVRHFWTLAHLFRYWLGSHYGSPVLDQVIIRIIPEQGRHNWWGYEWGYWEHCVSWLATLYWQEINISCEQTLLLQSAPFFQDNIISDIKTYLIRHKSEILRK